MTATTSRQLATRPVRREAATHRFAIGQMVHLRTSFGTSAKAAEIYRIVGTLPPVGTALQYRLRSDDERHERMATEDNLDAMATPPADEDADLMERTFGGGSETPQP